MNSILDIIKPIKLLKGSHENTGTTGQGCAMNVIAYLNGEAQITDESPCVCVTVRPIIIWLNDYMVTFGRGQELIPYLLRAMGSATTDQVGLKRRSWAVAEFARECAEYALAHAAGRANVLATDAIAAARYAADAARYAADAIAAARYAARYAADANAIAAARYAAADAARYAADAIAAARVAAGVGADAANYQLIEIGLRYLDTVLPPLKEMPDVVEERAKKLVSLSGVAA